MTARPTVARSGFWTGVQALPRAALFLLRHPGAWPAAAVPIVVFLLLFTGSAAALVTRAQPWLEQRLQPETPWLQWGAGAAAWLLVAALLLAALLGAVVLTPPLSAPALEHLVDRTERQLQIPQRPPLGVLREIWCGLRAQALALAVGTALWLLGALLTLALPVLSPLTSALNLLIASLMVAWNLLDYPLTLWGVGLRERLAFFRAHWASVVGFGAMFAALFWIPGCGLLSLPIGVIAATDLCWRLLLASPSSLPSLPRPEAPLR